MFFEWVVKCEFPATGRNVYVTNTLREIARTILSIPTCGFLEFFFIAPMETRSTGVRCSRANRRPTTFMVAYFVQWLSEIPKGSWNLCATEVSVVELECKTWHTWASEINGKCRGEIYWRQPVRRDPQSHRFRLSLCFLIILAWRFEIERIHRNGVLTEKTLGSTPRPLHPPSPLFVSRFRSSQSNLAVFLLDFPMHSSFPSVLA